MTREEIAARTSKVILAHIAESTQRTFTGVLTEDTSLVQDLEFDSLDIIEVQMALEDEFDLEVNDDITATFHTYGDVLNGVAAQLAVEA